MLRDQTRTLDSPPGRRKIPDTPEEPSPTSYLGQPPFNKFVLLLHSSGAGCWRAVVFSTAICRRPFVPYVKYNRDPFRMPRIRSAALRRRVKAKLHSKRGTVIELPCKSCVTICSSAYAATAAKLVMSISSRSQPLLRSRSSKIQAGFFV